MSGNNKIKYNIKHAKKRGSYDQIHGIKNTQYDDIEREK